MSEFEKYDAFEKQMREKYPRYFRNVYCGISIGEGWFHIIDSLCANVQHHIKWKRENRARELRLQRAAKRGREAVAKLIAPDGMPTIWQEERIDEIMTNGVQNVTPYVPHIEIHQIKEKFGGLRFYYQGGDDYVSGVVDMAESWAAHTCETCGERGTRRQGGWIHTLCDKHEAEYQERNKKMREED